MMNATGEMELDALRPQFNERLMLMFSGFVVISEAGLLSNRANLTTC
jgi:hypothetical protein